MPNCSIVGCGIKKSKNQPNISLHRLPKNDRQRNIWLDIIGVGNIKRNTKTIYVCSLHFDESCLNRTLSYPVLRDDAVPSRIVVSCRICMAMGIKMYDASHYRLGEAYEQLTGTELTVKDVQTASQTHRDVNSSLTQKLFKPNVWDVQIEETIEPYCPSDGQDMAVDKEKIQERPVEEKVNSVLSQIKSELKPDAVIDNGEKTDELFFEYEEQYSDRFVASEEIIETTKADTETAVVAEKSKVDVQRRTKEDNKEQKADIEDKPQDILEKRKVTVKPITATFDVSPLTFEEQIAELQKRKESGEYQNAPFKCEVCYKWFAMQARYETHAVRHSEKNGAFECCICKHRFRTAHYMKKHVTGQHTETYRCKKCPFVTRHRAVARGHEYCHIGDGTNPCPHCDKVFKSRTTLYNHVRIMHASDHACEFCGYTFLSKAGLKYHKKIKHNDIDIMTTFEGPHCDECDVKFVSDEAHKRHLRTSSKHCSYDDPNRLRNESDHLKVKKINGPVTCNKCGVQCASVRSRAMHYWRAHPGHYTGGRSRRPMPVLCVCELCGKEFKCKTMLESHMWVHTGVKIYKCDACAKSFSFKTNLTAHKEREHGKGTTYDCEVCGKSFKFVSNKQRHMAIHTGFKPFKCECGKSFTSPSARKAHIEHEHLKKPYPKRGPRVRKKPTQPLKSQENEG